MVKVILRLGVPALFTAYHKEEAILERSMLESMGGVQFVLQMGKNKWYGTIPNINIIQKFMTGKNVGFSYNNHFLYILKGAQTTN
jgi:hypothetical protein